MAKTLVFHKKWGSANFYHTNLRKKTRFFWRPAPGKIPRVGRGRWSGHAQRPPQEVHLPPKPQDNGASTAEFHGDSWTSNTSKLLDIWTHKKRVTRIINPTVTLG